MLLAEGTCLPKWLSEGLPQEGPWAPVLTEGSKGNLQEMFADPRKEKCRLAGAGSLGPKEKTFGGLTGPALSQAMGLAPVPTSPALAVCPCMEGPWGPALLVLCAAPLGSKHGGQVFPGTAPSK